MTNLQKIHHLLNRAAFGPAFNDLLNYKELTPKKLTHELFSSSRNFNEISIIALEDMNKDNFSSLTPAEKKELRKIQREQLLDLNRAWIEKMCTTDAILREKMTLFWHDHFACYTKNPLFAQDLNNILRRHALGNFGDMLLTVSKSPAMLQYLNNQQNRAKSPNENFAREVMELFTLGRDNYTETDIKNAARAFTGWGFNKEGEFIFRRKQHDYGKKTFMGHSGNFGGEDILSILIDNKKTANYITGKIYHYFINEEPDSRFLSSLADSFYNSGYDIGKLMYDIFTSERFYDEKNINSLIKSPVELMAGYGRLLPVKTFNKKSLIRIQRSLGQVLFMPPNVGGWPYGKEWINSTSIVYRMQIPYTFINLKRGKKAGKKTAIDIDWKQFNNITRNMNSEELTTLILGKSPDASEKRLIRNSVERIPDKSVRNSLQTISWLCLPEYQLA